MSVVWVLRKSVLGVSRLSVEKVSSSCQSFECWESQFLVLDVWVLRKSVLNVSRLSVEKVSSWCQFFECWEGQFFMSVIWVLKRSVLGVSRLSVEKGSSWCQLSECWEGQFLVQWLAGTRAQTKNRGLGTSRRTSPASGKTVYTNYLLMSF